MVDHLPLPDNPLLDLIEDLAASGSELLHDPQIVFRHVGFPRPGYHCSAVHPQNIVHFEPLRVCSPFQTCQRSSAMEAKRRDSVTDSPEHDARLLARDSKLYRFPPSGPSSRRAVGSFASRSSECPGRLASDNSRSFFPSELTTRSTISAGKPVSTIAALRARWARSLAPSAASIRTKDK